METTYLGRTGVQICYFGHWALNQETALALLDECS